MKPGDRCGWCITGDCPNCVVAVQMGETRSRDEKRSTGPYPWRCKCGCERSVDTKCLNCHRVGVSVEKYRCIDTEECRLWIGQVKQPPVREIRV